MPLGRHALAHFAPDARISEVHGTLLLTGGWTLFPLYHPAAALRSRALRETLFADARQARRSATLSFVRFARRQPATQDPVAEVRRFAREALAEHEMVKAEPQEGVGA